MQTRRLILFLIFFLFAASVGACDITHWKSTVDSTTGLVTWENVPCKFIKPGTVADITTIRDLLKIDTIWGELDSIHANMCMAYSGLYDHVLVARRGFDCGLGTADQQWGHWCGCECRWYDIWRKIERIDTVEVPDEKNATDWKGWELGLDSIYPPTHNTARDQDNCSLLHFVTQYHGGIAFIVHTAKHCPAPAREYMRVDTVGYCVFQDSVWDICGLTIFEPPDSSWCPTMRRELILDTTWLPIPVDIWIKDSTVDILE